MTVQNDTVCSLSVPDCNIMWSLRNIFLIAPPPQNPFPPAQINITSSNLDHAQSNFNESDRDLGLEEKVCRDCGNRAKKECGFGRCRTCCKSRGYDCPTHVKSTWVAAAQRRERKVAVAGGSSSSSSKKPRTDVLDQNMGSTPNNACNAAASVSLRLQTDSSHQDASFKESLPGKVQAPAVFRRIRVTAISDGEAEIAYQATVTISGHVFKGFLYDYGFDPCFSKLNPGSSDPIDQPHDPLAAPNE